MKTVKKSVLVISLILLVFVCFSMSISAINTPWIPIKPDGGTTESSSPTNEISDTTGAENAGGSLADVKNDEETVGDALPSDTEVSIDTDLKISDATDEELMNKTGCRSMLGGYAVLASCLIALVCVSKSGKENE